MPNDQVSVEVALNLDEKDLDKVFDSYLGQLSQSFSEALNSVDDLQRSIKEIVKPMEELAKHADDFVQAMKAAKDISSDIRQNMSSIRTQNVNTGGGFGMNGGFPSSMGGAFNMAMGAMGLGGVGAGVSALGPPALFGGAAIGGSLFDMLRSRTIGGEVRSLLGGLPLGGGLLTRALDWATGGQSTALEASRYNPLQSRLEYGLAHRGVGGVVEAMGRGYSMTDIMSNISGSNMALAAGGTAGLMRGIGQGPIGLFSQVVGGGLGAQGGYDVAQSMGLGQAGGALFATLGGTFMPGMLQNYIQEGMSRYPGYLATMASMASVGQYGGSMRNIRGLRPSQFGYGPNEIGPEFSALYQGFGGGDLSNDTLRTSMAYSRAYGVSMGQIGSAMGGLINFGGGGTGNLASAATREQLTARIMADAISEGFGRRLPEFAQAVGSGLSMVANGPALLTNRGVEGLIPTMSRLTGLVASRNGVGLQGAGRLLQPLASAPQDFLGGLMGEGGDPYRMAMLWTHNRRQWGNDPMTAMRDLVGMAQDPFSERSLNLQRGGLEEVFRTSSNPFAAIHSIRQMFPGMTAQGALGVYDRGTAAMREHGGSLQGADMLQIFEGVSRTEVNEGQQTRETMRSIQRSGERIMNEQLQAMRANAGFQESQLGVSAAMARDAATFYRIQLGYTRVSAQLMQASAAGQAIQALGTTFSPEFASNLASMGSNGPRMQAIFGRLFDWFVNVGGSEGGEMTQMIAEQPNFEGGNVTEFGQEYRRLSGRPTARRTQAARARAATVHDQLANTGQDRRVAAELEARARSAGGGDSGPLNQYRAGTGH